jgi:hypothetical protein
MFIFTTIKLDKVRNIKFTIGVQMRMEAELGKRIHVLMAEMTSVEETIKMLWMGLQVDDPSLTYEQVVELVDKYTESSNDVMDAVSKALMVAITGKKGEDFIKTLEGNDEKNVSGPDTTGTSS